MEATERDAILAIALMAAHVDGAKDDTERAHIARIAEGLTRDGLDMIALNQDVLLGRVSPEALAARLDTQETRRLAYEMAVCVCDADGVRNDPERALLERLRRALGLDAGAAEAYAREADAVAALPVTASPTPPGAAAATPVPPSREGDVVAAQPEDPGAVDAMILNYAIVNGALELLPQSLATMAIIPLQMKMVYRIGKAHGYELDRGHVKDFLATLGIGLTGQYVEEIGRKLLGGLLRKVGGRLVGKVGNEAAGAAMSFATTYALGHVARSYYAGGRTLTTEHLERAYASALGEAETLRSRYAGQISDKARTLDLGRIAQLIRQQ